jgi:hypothetical protein
MNSRAGDGASGGGHARLAFADFFRKQHRLRCTDFVELMS